MEIFDTVILGAGPSGLKAAIVASRGNGKTLVVEPRIPHESFASQYLPDIAFENMIGRDHAWNTRERVVSVDGHFRDYYLRGISQDLVHKTYSSLASLTISGKTSPYSFSPENTAKLFETLVAANPVGNISLSDVEEIAFVEARGQNAQFKFGTEVSAICQVAGGYHLDIKLTHRDGTIARSKVKAQTIIFAEGSSNSTLTKFFGVKKIPVSAKADAVVANFRRQAQDRHVSGQSFIHAANHKFPHSALGFVGKEISTIYFLPENLTMESKNQYQLIKQTGQIFGFSSEPEDIQKFVMQDAAVKTEDVERLAKKRIIVLGDARSKLQQVSGYGMTATSKDVEAFEAYLNSSQLDVNIAATDFAKTTQATSQYGFRRSRVLLNHAVDNGNPLHDAYRNLTFSAVLPVIARSIEKPIAKTLIHRFADQSVYAMNQLRNLRHRLPRWQL